MEQPENVGTSSIPRMRDISSAYNICPSSAITTSDSLYAKNFQPRSKRSVYSKKRGMLNKRQKLYSCSKS